MKVLDFDKHSLEIKHKWLTTDQDFNLKEHFSFRAYLDYNNSEVTLDINQDTVCKFYTKFYRKDLRVQPVYSFMVWLENIHSYLNRYNLFSYKILCNMDQLPGVSEYGSEYGYDFDKYTFVLLKEKDYLYRLYSQDRFPCPDFKPLLLPDSMGFKKLSHRIST